METTYSTARLLLTELALSDADFIAELVNTEEWIRYIGDRNIKTHEDAIAYVQKIMENASIRYWVVKLKEELTPIGIITLIRRDYLEHADIGFAFLPKYAGQGYAYEATAVVLEDALNGDGHARVLAITVASNRRSIQLLEKLGFRFSNEIDVEKEKLLVYSV